jgi:hypothetical protein
MMKIDYQETTNDLLTRIDIHQKYAGQLCPGGWRGVLHRRLWGAV